MAFFRIAGMLGRLVCNGMSTTNPREPVRNFVCKAYRVFRKMLESGHPPDDWSKLLAEARAEGKLLHRQVLVLDA